MQSHNRKEYLINPDRHKYIYLAYLGLFTQVYLFISKQINLYQCLIPDLLNICLLSSQSKMNFRLFIFVCLAILFKSVKTINPYHVLQLQEAATEQQIRKQYKLLRRNAKDNNIKLQLYKQAYKQIMLDSTLQMVLPKQPLKPINSPARRNRRRRRGLPRLSDMFRRDYVKGDSNIGQKTPSQRALQIQDQKNYEQQMINQHGYQLPPEIDDKSFYTNQKKSEQILRDQNISFNIKAARFIFFIGGILLKLSPCICLYMIYKFRRQNPRDQMQQQVNPFTKAANGWSGKNRKSFKKTN